ncbi:MAG: ribonuclease H-like domain-containing protein [Nitrosotalea sp.]
MSNNNESRAWSPEEIKILGKYAKPSTSLIQIVDTLHTRGFEDRTKKAIEQAIYRYDIRKDPTLERIGFYDIEATNLASDFGYMLCWYLKEQDKHDQFWFDDRLTKQKACNCKPRFISWSVTRKDIQNHKWDLEGCKQFLQVARDFDRVIGYFSKYFDSQFIKDRCLYWAAKGYISRHEIDAISWGVLKHTDVWRIAKNNINPHSRRLESLVKFFHIGEKTDLDPEIWISAQSGDPKALNYIEHHCKSDVLTLEIVAHLMRPFTPHKRESF